MFASSSSVVALAQKTVKPDTKLSLGKSLLPKLKSSNSLPNNRMFSVQMIFKPKVTYLFDLKSCYSINEPFNKHSEIIQ